MAINLGVCSHFFTSILMMTGAFNETLAKAFQLQVGIDDQGMHGAWVWQSTQMFLVPQVMKNHVVDQWGLRSRHAIH